jgi:DNA (cytosine-5)-methyltransferase 1
MEKLIEPYNTDVDGNCFCLKANYYKMGGANFIGHTKDGFKATCVMEIVGNIYKGNKQASRIYSKDGICPTLSAMEGGNTEPKIIERDTPMKGNYKEPRICTMVGRDPNNPSSRVRSDHYEQYLEMGNDVSNTLTSVQKDNLVAEPNEYTAKTLCLNSKVDGKRPSLKHRIYDAEGISTAMTTGFLPSIKESTSYRIRKLTPRECFRLMGVSETNIDKIQQSGVSQSQQYKMAGNSIVVDVLEHIFRKLFVNTGQESQQLSLF